MLSIACLKTVSFAIYWEIQGLSFWGISLWVYSALCMQEEGDTSAHGHRFSFLCVPEGQYKPMHGYSYCCREEFSSMHFAPVPIQQHFCCQGHLSDLPPRPIVARFLHPLSDSIIIVSFRNTAVRSLMSSYGTKHVTNNFLVKWLQKFTAAVTPWKPSPVCMSMLPLFFHFVFGIGMEPCWQTTKKTAKETNVNPNK